jgi:hypothetical protein
MKPQKKELNLAQSLLKDRLHYDPLTGIFANKEDLNTPIGRVSRGYMYIRLLGETYSSHRLAFLYMTGEFPPEEVDHINRDRLDNRWENLRSVSHSENNRNKRINRNNTSGKMGVVWHKRKQRWEARISDNHIRKCLGYFDSLDDAIAAREKAERELGYHANHGK